jgi:PAS domain S-box-containing protein
MGMPKDRNRPEATADLRRKAEEQIRTKSAEIPPPRSKQESSRLVHELEVHQIELEMQNAELLQVREQMEMALDKYTNLYDFAPVGYCTLDRQGTVVIANLTIATLFNIECSRLLGRRFGSFVADDYRQLFSDFLEKAFSCDTKSCDLKLTKEGNLPSFVRIEARPLISGNECHIAIIDISGRRRAEESFHQTRLRLAWVLEITSVGLWLNEMPLNRLTWDAQIKRLFYVDPDVEPTFDLFLSRLHPDDIEPTRLALENAIRTHTLYAIDHRAINPVSGEIRWIHSAGQATYAADDLPIHFDGLSYDITERKQTEDTIQRYNTDLICVNAELSRFNSVSVDRELRMIELKKEINELCVQYGQTPRYPLDFIK